MTIVPGRADTGAAGSPSAWGAGVATVAARARSGTTTAEERSRVTFTGIAFGEVDGERSSPSLAADSGLSVNDTVI
ncbi:hypothetical protein GCM10009738_05180 [Kitasatospora viridis]